MEKSNIKSIVIDQKLQDFHVLAFNMVNKTKYVLKESRTILSNDRFSDFSSMGTQLTVLWEDHQLLIKQFDRLSRPEIEPRL